MSWDAALVVTVDGHDMTVADWNYTHNTNRMIREALGDLGERVPDHFLVGPCWWEPLNALGAAAGASYLTPIIDALAASPEWFRAMNPPNGWGDYDRLLVVLREMRDAAIEWPSARWECSG